MDRFYAEPTVCEAEDTTLGRTVALKFSERSLERQAGPGRIPARSACSGGAWVSEIVPSKNATWHWR